MKWTVIWMPVAQGELADVWMASSERMGVTHASNRIDHLLAGDPDAVGDVIFDTLRALIVSPLGVEYEIDADDCQVRILSVWDATKGQPDPTGN